MPSTPWTRPRSWILRKRTEKRWHDGIVLLLMNTYTCTHILTRLIHHFNYSSRTSLLASRACYECSKSGYKHFLKITSTTIKLINTGHKVLTARLFPQTRALACSFSLTRPGARTAIIDKYWSTSLIYWAYLNSKPIWKFYQGLRLNIKLNLVQCFLQYLLTIISFVWRIKLWKKLWT